jgi:hypothetical protein
VGTRGAIRPPPCDLEWNCVRPFPPSLSDPPSVLDSFCSRGSVNDRAAFIMRPASMVCDSPGILLKRWDRSAGRVVLTCADLRSDSLECRCEFPIATSASIRKVLSFPVRFIPRQVHHVEPAPAYLFRRPVAHHAALRPWYVRLCPISFGTIGNLPNGFERRIGDDACDGVRTKILHTRQCTIPSSPIAQFGSCSRSASRACLSRSSDTAASISDCVTG